MRVDLKKQLADYHPPNGRFELVTVPPRHYLMIDGHGDPNTSPVYAEALAALQLGLHVRPDRAPRDAQLPSDTAH